MGKTKIEWADRVWNPVIGCTPISDGCKHCYAKRMAERFAGAWGLDPANPFAVKLHPERLDEPMRWKKPSMVFVCSMSDLFHDDVPDSFLDKVFGVMAASWWHTFLVLTKRPERMENYLSQDRREGWAYSGANGNDIVFDQIDFGPMVLPNVWLGVTAENQEQADARIPILLSIPATKRFVSVEPMLGSVDIAPQWVDKLRYGQYGLSVLDWVICGGESGPGARPMHPDWARSLRDQCNAAGTPFMFKQWGEWAAREDLPIVWKVPPTAEKYVRMNLAGGQGFHGDSLTWFQRVGKKAADRLLDGQEWLQYPADGAGEGD